MRYKDIRPANMRPAFTDSTGTREKFRPDADGPVYHAGRPVKIRPVWRDDFGAFRIGRTGDMIQMFDDLGINDRSF